MILLVNTVAFCFSLTVTKYYYCISFYQICNFVGHTCRDIRVNCKHHSCSSFNFELLSVLSFLTTTISNGHLYVSNISVS